MIRDWVVGHQKRVVVIAILAAIIVTLLIVLAPLIGAVVGILGAWTAVIAVAIWDRWDRIEKYGGRAVGAVSYITGRGRRVGLSAEMQGLINGARKDLEEELPDVMPLPARVRFVKQDEDIAALGEGEVVISLKDPRRRAENTARATMAYVSTAAVRPARPYVARAVMTGIDFSLTKKFLKRANMQALDYFLTEIWTPEMAGNLDLHGICDQVERIEGQGVLSRILLAEFLELGRRLWGQHPSLAVHSETREFLRYVATSVDRQPRDPPRDLQFIRQHLKVGTVLVGERDRAEAEGARPYVAAALWSIRQGCTSVYLLGRGARCDLVREVVANLQNDGRVRAIDISDYVVDMGDKRVSAICAHLSVEQPPRPTAARKGGRHGRPGRSAAPARPVGTT